MRVSSFVAAVLTVAVVVEASNEVIRSIPRKHSRSLLDHHPKQLTKRASKRCQVKPAANAANDKTSTTSSKKPASTSNSSTGGGSSSTSGGVTHVTSPECPNNGATKKVEKTTGPNGSVDFLDCGINSPGGWNPPDFLVSDLILISLTDALEIPSSPFQACKPYLSLFNKYADQYGLEPIMLASTALEESSCNPTADSDGTVGLMQVSSDKCDGAPGGNCMDPAFNIEAGAKYMSDTLKSNGNNIVLTLGIYNGWFKGMTYEDATKAKKTGCCTCQNNLDYIFQLINGYYQGVDPYQLNLGLYFNLNDCS